MTSTDGSSNTRRLALQVQAELIDLDSAVRAVNLGDDLEAQESGERIRHAVYAVWDAYQALIRNDPAGVGFIPEWLRPALEGAGVEPPSGRGGLSLLQSRIRLADGPWQRIGEHLDECPAGYLLNELVGGLATATAPLGTAAVSDIRLTDDPQRLEFAFPAIHVKSNRGIVLEIVAYAAGNAGGSTIKSGLRLTGQFCEGVAAGLRAGLLAAGEMGVAPEILERWHTLELAELHGFPPNLEVHDKSAGAAVAGAIMQKLLELPASEVLLSGAVSAAGEIIDSLNSGEKAVKSKAVEQYGLTLYQRGAVGAVTTACSEIWPEIWSSVVTRTAEKRLRQLEHSASLVENPVTPIVAHHPHDIVPTSTARTILRKLRAGAPVIVVGGPRSSARTVSTRQALLKFVADSEAKQRPIIELQLSNGLLPNAAELTHLVRLAHAATEVPMTSNALVVLEDLLPHSAASDLDGVLPGVAVETGVVIVAVCLYAGGTRWATDEVATVPSLVKVEQIKTFTEDFAVANNLDLSTEQLALARRAAGGDIWFLAHLLLERSPDLVENHAAAAKTATSASSSSPGGGQTATEFITPAEGIRRAYGRRICADLAEPERSELVALAACSLVRVGVPAELLAKTGQLTMQKLGAQMDTSGRWHLRQTSVCRALLASASPPSANPYSDEGWRRMAEAQYQALIVFFEPFLRTYNQPALELMTATLMAADATAPRLHRRLLLRLTDTLTKHITADAPAMLTAHALLAGGTHFSHEDRNQLLDALLKNLAILGWGHQSLRESATCLRAIRAHRDHAIDNDLQLLYLEVLAGVADSVRPLIVTRPPSEAVPFILELGRLFEESTAKQLESLVVAAVETADPRSVEHYKACVQLVEAALKYGAERRSLLLDRFKRSAGIRRMLKTVPTGNAGLVLAHIALRRLVDRTETGEHPTPEHRRLGELVRASLPSTTVYSFNQGLHLLGEIDGWTARGVLKYSGVPAWVRSHVWCKLPQQPATPWLSARLIWNLLRINGSSAMTVLYANDRITLDQAVLDSLSASVLEMADLKGAGHVLSALAAVDNIWGPAGESMSTMMVRELTPFINESLRQEVRGSVVLSLMTSLIGAHAPQEIIDGLLDRCAEVFLYEFRDNDKDHAPRLALLLAGHEDGDIAKRFLDILSARIDQNLLLSRMTNSQSIEARTSFHRLARALRLTKSDEFADRFLDDVWLESALKVLRIGNVLLALRAVQALCYTLQDAGMEFRREGILAGVHDEARVWAARLKQLASPAQLAEALHLLRALAPVFALECVRELNWLYLGGRFSGVVKRRAKVSSPAGTSADASTPSPMRIAKILKQKHAQDVVYSTDGIVRLVQREFVNPTLAIELIHAINRIDAPFAESIGVALSKPGSKWSQRARALRDIDSPVQLGMLMRMTARSAFEVPDEVLTGLFYAWGSRARYFRSPMAVQSLLRGFASWGPQGAKIARLWAQQIDVEGVARRISWGFASDLKACPMLLGALEIWGPRGYAIELAEAISDDAIAGLAVRDAAHLLRALSELDLALADRHSASIVGVIERAADREFIVDSETHWMSLGWLVRVASALPSFDLERASASLQRAVISIDDPDVHGWVAASVGLGRGSRQEEYRQNWRGAADILVDTRLGSLNVRAAGLAFGADLLERVSPQWQVELSRAALTDADLRGAIANQLEYLDDYSEWLVEVGQPVGRSLQAAIRSLYGANTDEAG
ncbi:hypothetical protein GCM10028799_08160 [Kribbella italica]